MQKKNPPDNHPFKLELSFLKVIYAYFFTTILKLVGQAAGLYLNLKFK